MNFLAREIWIWCIDKGIHLSAAHIAGVANVDADRLSRNFNDDLEWALDISIFDQIVQIYGQLDIDMFASRLNKKTERYVSRIPQPWAVDAFSLDWGNNNSYMFPTFSLITRILQKIILDKAEVVC